ncbi:hypothetical protein AJ79_05015 [Helicocarpus griseus UAMH5409]|uniref:O-methyltransferase C-terminal domain-containing protein n=1 Tax=Helicocarpus griseus UAMH5409 TaxID=1447875 RepID=A0A2B7XQY5_9EURO|nr:hypothetical protein AJ79_05015 [Helicocarpus griseus UAMH5409]
MALNSPEAVAQQNAAMKAQLAHVTSLVNKYCNVATSLAGKELTIEEHVKQSGIHTTVVQEAHKLLNAIKGPVDTLFCHFENVAHTGAVRALLDMGVFQALPFDGSSKTAETLSKELNADKELIVRLMRNATIWGPFKEVGVQKYVHTPYSLVYLVPQLSACFKLGQRVLSRPGPAPRIFQTKWMDCPFREVLSQCETTDDTPLVIDVGGGRGHTITQIKQYTGEGIKGRFILQESQIALDDITGELPGIEQQAYDFFTPQLVKDALIYYFRHVLHDWPDAACLDILRNVAVGITDKKRQRVVIADHILPEKGADAEAAWMDMTMLTLTGTERTEKQWRKLLDDAGFTVTRTFRGSGTNYAAIEAFLR